MKILYIILFIQIGWIFPLSAQKQDSIYIGTRHTLFSEILNEERKYWIYVPETKAGEKGKAYPVLYLLDGDSFFHSVVGFTRFFSSSKTSNLPPCIVVAVLNTDRTRDFTPTCSAARRDGTICPYDKPAGGGAEQFHAFLKTNVCFNVLMNKQKNHVLIMMVPHVQTAIVHHFYIATHAQVVQYPNCFIHQPPN